VFRGDYFMKIGVIGLGIIGSVYARNYAVAGKLAGSWNRSPKPDAPEWKDTPEAVTAAADVVQIVVADPLAVQSILDRIAPRLGPGKVVVQSSTIDPISSTKFSALVTARGARYLEAPFTGGKLAAESKKTIFYLGGDRALMAEVDPLLALTSEHRLVIGTIEQAASLKLAMNMILAIQFEGICEGLTLARRAGISDDVFFEVFAKNSGYSALAKMKEPKLRAGDFSPQFSVKHMSKDMRLALHSAGGSGLPLLGAVRAALHAAEARGLGDEDYSALIKLLDVK
jgi:3-hydroxyisobutyrate dehydrogenase-like beta-hydroxyacid dehydrogenase